MIEELCKGGRGGKVRKERKGEEIIGKEGEGGKWCIKEKRASFIYSTERRIM